ncbi:MAG: gamma-glutamylcyclotransferase family protein [Pseudomonadota bacterium]
MRDPFFFGYGSLVHRATHDYPDAMPARLRGWRRVWRHTPGRARAFLSVEPAPEIEIDGLIARVPGKDWGALDLREAGYARVPVTEMVDHGSPIGDHIEVYQVLPGPEPERPSHLLLSYIDVVAQGFLREYGEAGVAHFFETTAGWAAPLEDDRHAPIYARAQLLSKAETDLVDHWLGRVAAGVNSA